MGWFQRLFSGADGHDAEYRGSRSPDQARVSAEDLAGELRALHNEIKLLRESIGSGGRSITGSDGNSRRSRRGGRSRGGRDRDRDRNREGDGDRDRDRNREGGGDRDRGGRSRVGFDGEERPGRDRRPQRRSLPKTPPDDAPVGLLVDYLKTRGVVTFEGQDDLNRNEAFEHLARHLGMHFRLLANFYEKVKRCVATGRGQRIDIDGYTHAERSAAVQFGTLLHRHGMLKDFYYHRSPKKQLRVIPTKDGQVGQFLTGGWLEIYVSAVLTRRLRAAMSSAKFQLLYNVKGVLPDGREFEADLMAAVEGRLFWLECKTGQWQDYSARFRGLVKIFGVERESAALLLIKPPDAKTRARATDMLDMTLLSLDEVEDFISVFLGEPVAKKRPLEDAIEGSVSRGLGTVPPLTDDEIPLEDAEPARKLGVVDLSGRSTSADDEEAAPRRRRRRRRGGRGRNRTASAEGNEGSPAREESAPRSTAEGRRQETSGKGQEVAKRGSLLEPLPIERFQDEDSSESTAAVSSAESESSEGAAVEVAVEVGSERSRRRRRRRPTPFAAESTAEDSAESTTEGADTDVAAPQVEQSGNDAEADSSNQVEVEAEERPKRSRRRRPSAKPKKVEAAREEPVEEEAVSEVSARAESQDVAPEAQAEEDSAPIETEVEVKVEVEPEPEAELAPVKSAKGVTIAPDLAAMMAGSQKPASEED